jgi:hypothetical protein
MTMRVAAEWQQTVDLLEAFFAEQGLSVVRSFDLQTARSELHDPTACTCPYHGTDRCTCQYIVFLVYGDGEDPLSLVVHGHDQWTQIAIEHEAGAPTQSWLERVARLFPVARGSLVS